MMKHKSFDTKKILPIVLFIFLFILMIYKLTDASLWYDEATEYWFSYKFVSKPPYFPTETTIYQKIIGTFQPPLFNVLMFFWLKICDTEAWFRLLGVIAGMFCVLGCYQTTKLLTKKWYIPSITVVISMSSIRLIYYFLEVAEYYLMLTFISWTIYFFIKLIIEYKRKYLIGYIVMAILAVYSQYGAAFPVICMSIILLFNILKSKQRKPIIDILVAYFITILFAAIPLYIFFASKQISSQQNGYGYLNILRGSRNIFSDLVNGLFSSFRYSFFLNDDSGIVIIALIIIMAMLISSFFWGNKVTKYLNTLCLSTWIIYFIATKSGLYAYGYFDNRYGLFMVPLWIISIVVTTAEFFLIISAKTSKIKIRFDKYMKISVILVIAVYFFVGIFIRILPHWIKENTRDLVKAWYTECSETNFDTLVYYPTAPGFAYYLQHNKEYQKDLDSQIIYWPSESSFAKDFSEEKCEKMIDKIYNGIWPDNIYFAASQFNDDFYNLLNMFEQKGYSEIKIFDGRNEELYLFSRSSPN